MNALGSALESLLGFSNSVGDDIQKWFASLGGSIASGLEGGFIALVKDLWDVVIGPVEIVAGTVLILFGLVLAFKDGMLGVAAIAGMTA